METIKNGENIPYAIHIKSEELINDKTEWFTKDEYGIQVGGFNYNKEKEFNAHKHIFRERTYEYTQETIVIIKGKLLAKIYNNNNELISCFNLEEGDIGIFLSGGHNFRTLEDNTVFYEIKNGPFTNVESDKVFFE